MKLLKGGKFNKLLFPFLGLLFVTVALLLENYGVQYTLAENEEELIFQHIVESKDEEEDVINTCLVILDSEQDTSLQAEEQIKVILSDMRIGYDVVDMMNDDLPDFKQYKTAIIGLSNLDVLGADLMILSDWVKEGGGLMFMQTLDSTPMFHVIKNKLGILEGGEGYTQFGQFMFGNDFLLGGEGKVFEIEEPYDSSLNILLDNESILYMSGVDNIGLPLIWEREYGEGKFVVHNHGMCVKATRGFYSASYSLLEDVSSHVVINASSFFIDDFPSPVPQGNSEYVQRDYGRDVAGFYKNVWWPDILDLGERYGIKYTGLVIEDYNDITDMNIERNMDVSTFKFFGKLLLEAEGEIGYHGYNHIPFGLKESDFGDEGYKPWKSVDAMTASLQELDDFIQWLFPGNNTVSYVPPSNILSAEGRSMIVNYFPNIKVIASIYLGSGSGHEQEFGTAADGIVDYPRVISGFDIDSYMEIAAVSELNFHYVNSHFMHPDDILDEDRGAKKGWAYLKRSFEKYLEWLYTATPNIRNLTSQKAAKAIKQFENLRITRTRTEEALELKLDKFYEEAYIMLRFNKGTPGKVEGGELERLSDHIYMLHAEDEKIKIEVLEEGK